MSTTCNDGKPCPIPVEGRGPGDSRCEQNGLCQRLELKAAPVLRVDRNPANSTLCFRVEEENK